MEQPTVEISKWGELALIEELLSDWTMGHGRSHHYYYHAHDLLKRVRPALMQATKNLMQDEQ